MNDSKAYLIFDKISPRVRTVISVMLIITAFLLQWSTNNILAGIPFVIICLLLNLVKNVIVKKVMAIDSEWQEVTPDRIEEVLARCRAVKKFRSKNLGCFVVVLFLFFFMVGFVFPLLKEISPPFPVIATTVNAVILFSGLILSGRKSAWIPPGLDIKADELGPGIPWVMRSFGDEDTKNGYYFDGPETDLRTAFRDDWCTPDEWNKIDEIYPYAVSSSNIIVIGGPIVQDSA